MEKSLKILAQISTSTQTDYTKYAFSKDKKSKKYNDGRVTAAKWINELFYHYVQKEKNFVNDFKEHIQEQKSNILALKNSEYKQGILDQLEKCERELDDRVNSNK